MFSRYRFKLFLILTFTAGLLITCGNPPSPTIARDISVNPNTIKAGTTANLSIEASGEDLQFEWTALNGKIVKQVGPSASYTASDLPGDDTVIVTITGRGGTITKKLQIQIVAAAAQATGTAPPATDVPITPPTTNVQSSSPQPQATTTTPPATNVQSSSPQPQSPLKLNINNGNEVAQTITLMGEYPPDFAGDLWVFVVPPSGLYYPQSPNACEGQGTPKANGKWEIRVGFGGPDNEGIPFKLIIAEADPQASQSIANTLRQWCQAQNFPGIDDVELPAGTTLKETIVVTRNADRWGPTPPISNATLPGQITLANVMDGDQVSQSKLITGTYTADITHDIWLMIYAVNGRWYPQSVNACQGVHTAKASGKWQVPVGFGGDSNVGEPFDIVVLLADAEASAFFDAKQREWCANKNFPGFLLIELPQGIDVKQQVRVFRQ
jgi:hypothetical protein